MMKKSAFLLFAIAVSLLLAEKLEITADKFLAKDADKEVRFVGNAHIVQGATRVKAAKVIVTFNEDNSTRKYRAVGGVQFFIKKAKANYRGSCNEMLYLPQKKQYLLTGNVKVKDQQNRRDITASKVKIDSKTGAFMIEGSRKHAAKLTFDMK